MTLRTPKKTKKNCTIPKYQDKYQIPYSKSRSWISIRPEGTYPDLHGSYASNPSTADPVAARGEASAAMVRVGRLKLWCWCARWVPGDIFKTLRPRLLAAQLASRTRIFWASSNNGVRIQTYLEFKVADVGIPLVFRKIEKNEKMSFPLLISLQLHYEHHIIPIWHDIVNDHWANDSRYWLMGQNRISSTLN